MASSQHRVDVIFLAQSLVLLTITSVSLTQPAVAQQCPQPCTCLKIGQRSHVTCFNQSLTRIPEGLPDNVNSLDLRQNKISSLTDVFHSNTQFQRLDLSFNILSAVNTEDFNSSFNTLQELDLSSNNISSIEKQAFTNLPNLCVLRLSNNFIHLLDGEAFVGNSLIEEIYAANNVISSLTNDTFLNKPKLAVIDLSHNAIREIPQLLFESLPSLTVLNLHHNLLQEFDGGSMDQLNTVKTLDLSYNDLVNLTNLALPELESLNLGWNNIQTIDSCMFCQTKNLTNLVLDGNPLTAFKTSVFSSLTELRNLSMSSMPNLTYLSKATFEGLNSLQTLLLQNNSRLSFIHKELFQPLMGILAIDLRFNNITTLQNSTLSLEGSLQSVKLQGNVFVCDCSIEWLLEDIQSNGSMIVDWDILKCRSEPLNQTMFMSNFSKENLHCSDVSIVSYSPDGAFKIGTSVTLKCEAVSDPSPEIVWITPRKRVLHQHDFHYLFINDIQAFGLNAAHNNSSPSDDLPPYYSQNEARTDRMLILRDGSLYIDYIMRGDAGKYKCIAKNPRNSTEVTIEVSLDYSVLTEVKIWSLVIGFSSAGGFFLLNLIYSLSLAAIRRCVSQRRRERIGRIIESMDHYKTAQLSRIKENYHHQVGKIRDQYHYQLGRLREHHQNQMGRMGRMREGASQKVDRLKENYNNQLGRLKDYSSSQLVQLREKYNSQVDKIKDYGNDKLERLHEKYKLKQQHVIRLLDMMNLDKCRSAFETECVRTESMILQSEVFNNEVPLHSPIDSVSVSDSEYMTATSTESSKYSSQRNIHRQSEDSDDAMTPMNPYVPDECGDEAMCETSFTNTIEKSNQSMKLMESLQPSMANKVVNHSDYNGSATKNISMEMEAQASDKHSASGSHHKTKQKGSNRRKRRQRRCDCTNRKGQETEQLYTTTCDITTVNDSSVNITYRGPTLGNGVLSDDNTSQGSDQSKRLHTSVKVKGNSRDRPLSVQDTVSNTASSERCNGNFADGSDSGQVRIDIETEPDISNTDIKESVV